MDKAEKKLFFFRIESAVFILAIAALLLMIGLVVFGKPLITVSGSSMYPTYRDGDILQAEKVASETEIRRGDVIVFRRPDKNGMTLIKRVIGVPGDRILIDEKGIHVNGSLLSDSLPAPESFGIAENGLIVPDSEYFVIGDNRNHSTDSRVFGTVPASMIRSRISDVSGLNNNVFIKTLKQYFFAHPEEE